MHYQITNVKRRTLKMPSYINFKLFFQNVFDIPFYCNGTFTLILQPNFKQKYDTSSLRMSYDEKNSTPFMISFTRGC